MRQLPVLIGLFCVFQAASSLENACSFKEFRCNGGTACLKTEKLCNGIEDCPDGEDEKGNEYWDCSKKELGDDEECNQKTHFTCRFGGCIVRSQQCDGIPQCWGGTDEATELCTKAPPRGPRPPQGGGAGGGGGGGNRRPPTKPPVRIPIVYPDITPTPAPERRTPPPRRQTEPPPRIQESQRPRPTPSPPRNTPQGSCPALEPESGVDINCSDGLQCLRQSVPDGTRAEYKCKPHYIKPLTASETHERVCKKGRWSTRNKRWHCALDCGEANITAIGFVVGGYKAIKGKWPWHVGLFQQDPPGSGKYEFFCGASLISEDAVLTAAHCVTRKQTADKRTDDIVLYLGKYHRNYKKNDEFVQKRGIKDIEIHENYNPYNYDADIAIIWLDERADITDRVRPVCLPRGDDNLDPDPEYPGTLVGWGRAGTAENRVFVEELQEARLPIVGRRACQKAHPALAQLTRDSTFCAGYRNGTSACDGDSGGGLVFEDVKIQNRWRIQGIVSAGVNHYQGGCNAKFYTVFTKVQSFLDWVHEMLDRIDKKKRKRRSL